MNTDTIQLGLKDNWQQFSLLLIVNAFVGGMIGLERTILPKLAEEEFNIVSTSLILSFIIVFGVSKAITNYFTGTLANAGTLENKGIEANLAYDLIKKNDGFNLSLNFNGAYNKNRIYGVIHYFFNYIDLGKTLVGI